MRVSQAQLLRSVVPIGFVLVNTIGVSQSMDLKANAATLARPVKHHRKRINDSKLVKFQSAKSFNSGQNTVNQTTKQSTVNYKSTKKKRSKIVKSVNSSGLSVKRHHRITTKIKLPTPNTSATNSGGYTSHLSVNQRQGLVANARQYLGYTYQYGGNGQNHAFDCSGLTQTVYASQNVTIPRVAQDQYNVGQLESESQAQPGDLVFFGASTTAVSHVGIYIGNGQMLDAQNNGVIIEAIHVPWWNLIGFCAMNR